MIASFKHSLALVALLLLGVSVPTSAQVVNAQRLHFTFGPFVRGGTGSPNSVVVGSVGDVWIRTDGGTATVWYVKESGTATNTGWVAYGGGGTGTVTSVGLIVPPIFNVSGSPVTTTGSITVGLVNQAANLVWAGPASGSAAPPTFRSLVAADVTGVGSVTSVAVTFPADFTVTGSPITTSGTIGATWASQTGNVIFGSPSGGGSGTPGFRSLVAADIPNLSIAKITSGTTLASTVLASSLTSVGTLTGGATGSGFTVDVGASTVSGQVAVANGGTGAASFTAHQVLIGEGDPSFQAVAGASGGTVTATGGSLTANAIMLGAGTTDAKVLASLGTTTTLLHGNAAGVPSFGAVALATEVSGTLADGSLSANVPLLNAANVFSSATGQSVKKLLLPGSSSGTLTVLPAAAAGTSTLTLPGGTTDFSATGGSNQVVKQTSSGGALTVAALTAGDLGTTLTPQFARVGFGSAADATAVATFTGEYFSPLVGDGNSGTAKTIDLSQGNEHFLTLTGSVTLTVTNPVDGGRYVFLLATGAGSFTVTWPMSFLWSGGTAPVITATASKVDVVTAIYVASTSSYYASFNQNF